MKQNEPIGPKVDLQLLNKTWEINMPDINTVDIDYFLEALKCEKPLIRPDNYWASDDQRMPHIGTGTPKQGRAIQDNPVAYAGLGIESGKSTQQQLLLNEKETAKSQMLETSNISAVSDNGNDNDSMSDSFPTGGFSNDLSDTDVADTDEDIPQNPSVPKANLSTSTTNIDEEHWKRTCNTTEDYSIGVSYISEFTKLTRKSFQCHVKFHRLLENMKVELESVACQELAEKNNQTRCDNDNHPEYEDINQAFCNPGGNGKRFRPYNSPKRNTRARR
jgi:hypothetical protein